MCNAHSSGAYRNLVGGVGGQQGRDHLHGLGVEWEIMLTGWEAVDCVIWLRTGTSVGPY